MSRAQFFDAVRADPFGGRLSPAQVAGMDAMLDYIPSGFSIKERAYCFATAYHETARTMQPVREYGSDKYLSKYDTGKLAAALGNTPQADGDGILYCGRGYVQLTGRANYEKAGRILNIDLLHNPALAMGPNTASMIMYAGMREGWFTGRKLSDYFGDGKEDPTNARRIINGTDEAEKVAGYYWAFKTAFSVGLGASPAIPVLPVPEIAPVAAAEPPSWWQRLLGMS